MQQFVGNLTRDAEIRQAGDKHSALNFTVAENRRVFKQGKYVREAVYIDCTLWNRDELAQYLTKGTQVQVHGDVIAEANNDKANLRIKQVLHIQLLSSGQRNNAQPGGNHANGQSNSTARQPRTNTGQRQPAAGHMLDDAPF